MKSSPFGFYSLIIVVAFAAMMSSACKHETDKPNPVNVPVSFGHDVQPLLSAKCATSGCHGGVSPISNINFEPAHAYNTLFQKHLVDTINPEQSLIYMQMSSVSNPMPPSGNLPAKNINMVLRWIKEGARNN